MRLVIIFEVMIGGRRYNAAGTGEQTAQRFVSPAHEVRGGARPCYVLLYSYACLK